GIVDGKELANQLLDSIELEAQRPGSSLTGPRKALVLKAIRQEAWQWVQRTSIGEVERIYFATVMNRLMDYAPLDETPQPTNPQHQSRRSNAALSAFFVSLILAGTAVVLYRVRPSIHWPDLGRRPGPTTASSPQLVPTLADLPEEHIKDKRV